MAALAQGGGHRRQDGPALGTVRGAVDHRRVGLGGPAQGLSDGLGLLGDHVQKADDESGDRRGACAHKAAIFSGDKSGRVVMGKPPVERADKG